MKRLIEWLRPASFESARLDRADVVLMAIIVGWGLFWLAPGLAHPGIHNWDEAMHQAAARGTYDTFFYPHIWSDHIWPDDPKAWTSSGVWMHKPTLPLWLAAIGMNVTGVTPLALRLVSLAGHILAAICTFLLARRAGSRFWAAAAAIAFLSLPFGWRLTQGVMFADVYDALLAGLVALTVLWLVRAVERDSAKWAALAGVALGLAHLTKTVLALAPFGVACVMAVLKLTKLAPGPRPRHVLAMGLAALATSGPWNLYCYLRWPVEFRIGMAHTFGHVGKGSGVDVGPWRRPVDAVFNELLATEFGPFPHALLIVGAVWLVVRSIRLREPAVIATALWVWSTWITHSMMSVKVPAQVWNAGASPRPR
jgi:4-amino-4-deoxy-L-arabinose transferase-like glycosyltransferase